MKYVLIIFTLFSFLIKSYGKIYFEPSVVNYFQNGNETTQSQVLKFHPYIPKAGYQPFFTAFKNIDNGLYDKLRKEEKIFYNDVKGRDYLSIAIYMIQNIIGEIEEKDNLNEVAKDFKNILAMMWFGSFLSSELDRDKIILVGIDLIDKLSPQQLIDYEWNNRDDDSAVYFLFEYLNSRFNTKTDEVTDFFNFGKLTARQKEAYNNLHFRILSLENNFSIIQIDTLSKATLRDKSPILSKNFLSKSDVINPDPIHFITPNSITEGDCKKLISKVFLRLNNNPYFYLATKPNLEIYKKLSNAKKDFLTNIRYRYSIIERDEYLKSLNISNFNPSKFHVSESDFSEFINLDEFNYVKDVYTFGMDISTTKKLSSKTVFQINQCLYDINIIITMTELLRRGSSGKEE